MSEAAVSGNLFSLALVGNPNCGKTALFNALTGSRQKVANYPGVTVERKAGQFTTPVGRNVQVLDLPGSYSLRARSPDEEVTREEGQRQKAREEGCWDADGQEGWREKEVLRQEGRRQKVREKGSAPPLARR